MPPCCIRCYTFPLLRENCHIVVRGNSTVRFSQRPAGLTITATSRASIRISVLGPRGCPRITVSSRGRRCQLTTPQLSFGLEGRRDGLRQTELIGDPVKR